MELYQRNFINEYGDGPYCCAKCGAPATDIHHIIPRSKFGKKLLETQDSITNLIALCRICHMKAHRGELSVDYLLSIRHIN